MEVVDPQGTVHVPYKLYRSVKVPESAKQEYLDEASSYSPQKDDLFIVTYPKCGTTWVQHIVFLIYNEGRPPTNASEVINTIPFPEQDGFPKTNTRYAMKYHLPFELMSFSNDSKYIYVVRNPMDTCVSYYHFLKNLPGYHLPGIDDFFEDFVKGDVPYGDYYDHLLSWSPYWHEPNVLFLTYEFIKENHLEAVRMVALFLEMEHVAENEHVLNDIVRYSRSDFMRSLIDDSDFMKNYLRITSCSENRDVFQNLTDTVPQPDVEGQKKPRMIRKACVGDWKMHLSDAQTRRMKEIFLGRTKGTNAENLWADIFHKI